jgi:hypothetical protein
VADVRLAGIAGAGVCAVVATGLVVAGFGYLTSWGPEERVAYTIFGYVMLTAALGLFTVGALLIALSRDSKRR